jgi:glycosyltransferase involved in cell wall biosynthesis
VYHYGCEGSEVNCTEDVSVVSNEYREKFYPPLDMRKQYTFNIDDEYHHTFHRNVANEVRKRKGERNLLLCAWGFGHKEIADLLGDEALAVESGIGYTDTFSKFRVFESYTWMHWVYGKGVQHDGSWYDAVIPNYFDPGDFEFREEKEDWLLYLGRIIKRKGVELASDLAHRTGHKLVIAGQGTLKNDAEHIDIKGDHIEFVGYADVAKRKDLMSRAKACIMPTYYVEPFGGVAIEAMLSGTPVISTDWGVFSEHTLHGLTGYRCRTMEQFEWAVNHIDRISPAGCRQWAIDNYSMDRVAKMYDEYFSMLSDLWRGGWYEPRPDRQDLDWLEKQYPYPKAPAS